MRCTAMDVFELVKDINEVISYSAGDVIFNEGDFGDHMYIIQEGEVDIMIGHRTMLTVGRGDILGEMALIENNPRSATTVAKTSCRLVPVSRKRFALMVQQSPRFAIDVMRVLAERLRRMNEFLK